MLILSTLNIRWDDHAEQQQQAEQRRKKTELNREKTEIESFTTEELQKQRAEWLLATQTLQLRR